MSPEQNQPPPKAVKKPKKDPFGPPLDASELRGVFRRLHARNGDEKIAFTKRLNWNLLDANTERRTMETLLHFLADSDPTLQNHAIETLKKLFHQRRGRYAPLFAAALPQLDVTVQLRVQDVFGPVLKPAPTAVTTAAPETPRAANADDLQRLQDFFRRKN